MRYTLLLLTTTAWALWLGGTATVFVFGLYFNKHLPHETFAASVDAMFAAFQSYQLALAGVALVGSGFLLVTYPSAGTIGLFAALLAAGGMAVTFGLGLLPIMQGMRAAGEAGSPAYMKLHGNTMMVMSIQAVILLGTGAILLAMAGRRGATVAVPVTADTVEA